MKVLVVGSGGREHALAWKCAASPRVAEVLVAPGNAGTAREPKVRNVAVQATDIVGLIRLARAESVSLTIIGPEAPLVAGVVDAFEQNGLRCFGPRQAPARLEGSKAFAKEFLRRHRIPTAASVTVTADSFDPEAVRRQRTPIVIKASGLAAGKGVVIAQTKEDAAQVAGSMISGSLVGTAGQRVVLEEFLSGEELSFLVLSDGERVAPLAAARDHKRVGDGDTGPNTGGMGAYSAPGIMDEKMREWLLHHVVRPTIDGMRADEDPYNGVLYCGLMMTARGPMVLEFNCRFGDPETQAIMLRLESDLVEALSDVAAGRLSEGDLQWSADAACCVVLASAGYPGKYETGKLISGLEEAAAMPGVVIFHAGTSARDHEFYTAGGRVLNVCARGRDLGEAVGRAYGAAAKINFDGMHYRKDIGSSSRTPET